MLPWRLAEFLAQDGVIRPLAGDQFADGAFGAAVGFGDGIESMAALLVRHIDALAEKGPDHRARASARRLAKAISSGATVMTT